MNVTARLAVWMENLPDFDYDWNNTEPQRNRDSLQVEDFLPSIEDSRMLKKRAVMYVMDFLVQTFPCYSSLSQKLTRFTQHQSQR